MKKRILLLTTFLLMLLLYVSTAQAESYTWHKPDGTKKTYTVNVKVKKTAKRKYKVTVYSNKKKVTSFKLKGKKPKIVYINPSELTIEMLLDRKGKNIIYVERCIGYVTNDEKDGQTLSGWYICYSRLKKAVKGDIVHTYFVYNPKTSYEDDVLCRIDYII